MPTFKISNFSGFAPRYNRRDLPAGWAQEAVNLRFDSGDLKPFRNLVELLPLSPPLGSQQLDTGLIPDTVVSGQIAQIGNLFHYRFSDAARWVAFGQNLEVTAVKSPVPEDQFRRFYWCIRNEGLRGISLEQIGSPTPNGAATGAGANFRQFAGYPIGIPAPISQPRAFRVAGQEAEVGLGTDIAITSISRTNPATINIGGEVPFEAGQRVVLRIDEGCTDDCLPRPNEPDDEEPGEPPGEGGGNENPEVGQIWALDGLEGVVANIGAANFDIVGINTTGFQEFHPDDIAALTVRRVFRDQDLEARSYVYTYVSQFGEEGPPSPPSEVIDIPRDGLADLIINDTNWHPDHGGTRQFVERIRIYRTVAGETASLFLHVGTLRFDGGNSPDSDLEWISPPSPGNPEIAWGASLRDPVPSISLGEPLPSDGWFPPPNNLEGILQLPNGIIAGWRNNTVFFSEPYLPHAWDPDNRLTLQDDVIGAEAYGNTMVVGTRGRPIVISGIDPASMIDRRLEHHAPLIHRRGIVDAGNGVIYVADNGLVWVGAGGARIISNQRYNKETWLEAVNTLTNAVYFDGRVILFSPNQQALVLSVMGDDDVAPSLLDIDVSAAVRRNNSLAMVTRDGGENYRQVRLFNEAATRFTGRWKSNLFTSTRPCNLSVGQVLADGYPVTLTVRLIEPTSYPAPPPGQPDLVNLAERVIEVQGPEPFRLPADYISREFEFEIESEHRVQRLVLTSSMDELRAA